MSKTHVDIDVAKYRLDVWIWRANAGKSMFHNEAGIDALCELLLPDRIVLKATGDQAVPLAATLQAASLPWSTRARPVNLVGPEASSPRPTVWMHSCQPTWRRCYNRPCVPYRMLTSRPCVRSWCDIAMCVQKKTHLDSTSPDLQPRIRSHLDWMHDKLGHLNRELQNRLRNDSAWQPQVELLRSMSGISPAVPAAKLPELEHLNQCEITALVSVALLKRDRGQHREQRHVWGSRASARTIPLHAPP